MQRSEYLEPHNQALREYYWIGHFFFVLSALVAYLTFYPLNSFYSPHAADMFRMVLVGLVPPLVLFTLQRNVSSIRLGPQHARLFQVLTYSLVVTGAAWGLVCFTGAGASQFKSLCILAVALVALNYGPRSGLLVAGATSVVLVAADLWTVPFNEQVFGRQLFLFFVMGTTGWLVGRVSEHNHHLAADLAQERNLLYTLLDNIPEGVMAVNRQNQVVFANREIRSMLGDPLPSHDLGTILDSSVWLGHDPMALLIQARRSGQVLGKRLDVTGHSCIHHVEMDMLRLTDEDTVLAIVRNINRDLELGRLQAQSGRLLEMVDLAVICTDGQGQVSVFNPAAERILGVPAETALELDEAGLWATAGLPQALLEQAQIKNFEHFVNNRHLQFNQTTIPDGGGRIVIVNDVTGRRRYEDEMARASMLSVVGEMAAGVAHEIRNPLVGVRGFAQLILEKDEPFKAEDTKRYMEVIISEVDRINRLITDFLTLARPRVPSTTLVDLNQLLRNTEGLASNEALMHDIDLSFELAPVPVVPGDGEQLRQVILNLLNNAFAAAGSGGKVVLKTSVSNGSVSISVRDNGPGIPVAVQNKIFNPFFTTKDEGSGLGLPICQRIINAHNGNLDFSTGASGTTFTVRLPIQ